jgi:hypothetical protein
MSPLLFGVPVAVGIVVTLANIIGTGHPDLLWATTVNIDAKELYLGHTLYQDPAHGYTGLLYTPLFAALVSLIYRVSLWEAWPVLLVIGATVALVGLTARLAYARAGSTHPAARMLSAAGIGGIAYWAISGLELPALEEARPDQLAWALALFGLVAVADFGPAPSRRRVVLAALLMSAAFWTKQTTVGVAIIAGAWVVGLAAVSALRMSAARLFIAVLAGVNLAVLLVLNLLTDGWEFYFNFEIGNAQWTSPHYWMLFANELHAVVLIVAVVLTTWLAIVLRRTCRLRAVPSALSRLLAVEDPTVRRALLLSFNAVLGFALAMYFRRKQGTSDNELIGVVWTLGLLAAVGWSVAQRNADTAMLAGGCVALLFAITQIQPIRNGATEADVTLPALERVTHWQEVPASLLALARNHTFYGPLYSDLNVPQGGPLYPNYYNVADLLAAGRQPTYLIQALLDRRFDDVEYFPLDASDEQYTSGFGKWEQNYLWKLDEVIAARYVETPELPEGVLQRRPGPEQAAWMRHCFGPFTIDGASFRIGRGGGFWCSVSPETLSLVKTPVPLSEILTTRPVRVGGTIAVTLGGSTPARLDLVLGGAGNPIWTAEVVSSPSDPRELTVSSSEGGRFLGNTTVTAANLPGGRRGLRLDVAATSARPGGPSTDGGGAATLTAPATRTTFALSATEGIAVNLEGASLAS